MPTLVGSNLLGAVALLAAAAAPAPPPALVFPTGAPELVEPADPATPGRYRLLSRAEYDDFAAANGKWIVVIHKVPASLSDKAGFGVNLVVGKNCGFAVDDDPKTGYVLYPDLNGNGDLTDDTPVKLVHRDGYYTTASLEAQAKDTKQGRSGTYPVTNRFLFVRVPTPSGWQMAYKIVHETVRRGTIDIGGRKTAFALFGTSGLYDEPGAGMWVDLDGDGKGMEDEDSLERFQPGNRYLKLGGVGYAFTIDRYGGSLTLTPADREVPDRVTLAPGTAAPDFSMTDIDGTSHRLADYRGKVLLIDAWDLWCHPCRDEAPALAKLYERYRKRGLSILGISSATARSVREYAREYHQRWPQVSDPLEGPIHALFRIRQIPTHILIDREGKIVLRQRREMDVGSFEKLLQKTLGED